MEGYRKRQAERKSDAKKRLEEFTKYPMRLFPGCAQLVVLRIDLFYRKDIAHQYELKDLQVDVKHLLDNKRGSKELAFMKGYIVKFEYGVDKGFHAHFLVFLDGSRRKGSSHVYLTKKLGEYWKNTITKGRGDYWIPYDSSADRMREAVEGVWGEGNVTVEGPDGGPWRGTLTRIESPPEDVGVPRVAPWAMPDGKDR